jgi:SAM-dependent methyltransferase
MNELQEIGHPADADYSAGSPHLKHRHLYDWVLGELRQALEGLSSRGISWTVLDVGAGHGSFTEPLLAYGCQVTATEMSRPSLRWLESRYGTNPKFKAALDTDRGEQSWHGQRYGLVLFASVLHHIPDYEAALILAADRVVPGGVLITVQDPTWFPRMPNRVRAISEIAYMSWRIGRGSYGRGVRSRLRRLRGAFDEREPSDMVEYHVVRQGVDDEAIAEMLARRFVNVRVERYWSTQSALWQRIGERLHLNNTFAIIATNRLLASG